MLIHLLVLFAVYFLVGVIFSYALWRSFVDGELRYYERARKEFTRDLDIFGDEIPQFLLKNWQERVEQDARLKACPPKEKAYRGRIGLVMLLWPVAAAVWCGSWFWEAASKRMGYRKRQRKMLSMIREDQRAVRP